MNPAGAAKLILVTAVAALSLLWAPPVRADDLVILSAAAVRPALVQLPLLFEKATGHRLTVGFGNATVIGNKVANGDAVDVVILPPRQLAVLIKAGNLAAEGRADLGVVRLGVAVRAGSTVPPVSTSDDFRKAMLEAAAFGMPDPAAGSTSSQHLMKVLAQLGIAEAMRARIRHFKDGTQALIALAKGEIALTVAPMTSIRVVPDVALAGPLPDELQSTTVYAAALSRKSAASEPAKALLAMLRSREFAALMRDKGIDSP
jgi:molybdate transport system substrate-binding protein